ncbi:hypothetical protein [Butyrivibrio sp. AE3004]|uniref:hypothetical protein n=1 Tax=Butyrivibrio sp. AE3004 TaxID=1506994 RepID=UPI000494545A|nr:hypothetical protein [Butyrivibrio sp. AE3004]
MTRFTRLGAAALAMALSITLVTPVSVNAMTDVDYKGSATADGTLDTTKDYTVTETRKETGKTYSYTKTADGKSTYDSSARDEALRYYVGTPSKVNVAVENYSTFSIALNYGETLDSVKVIKGKKNITLKKVGESTNTGYPTKDKDTKTYYFTNRDGSKAFTTLTEANYTEEAWLALQKKRSSFNYRLFGKSIGTAKIQYKVKDEAGKVTKKTITVNVTKDAAAFKSITYAGKELLYDYSKGANNNKYIYSGKSKYGVGYTTKKSGKLKVKMNKDYRLVNIWVEKDNDWVLEADSSNYDDEYGTRTETELVHQKGGVDLNSDGDCFDTIDGLSEGSKKTSNFTKLKNGGKLTLGKVADNKTDYSYSYQGKKYSKTSSLSTSKYDGNMATTAIHFIYQNKITKAYSSRTEYITLRISK